MPDSVIELVSTTIHAVDELIPVLRNPVPQHRLKALKSIVRQCPAGVACFDSLNRLLHDPNQNIRELAMQGISSYGSFALDTMIGSLSHYCKYVRRQAVWGLGKLEQAALPAVRELCDRLKDQDSRTAGGAAQALGSIGRDAGDAVPALAEAMCGTNVVLCRLASKALSQIGAPAIPTLIAHLKHHDPFVRGETAFALGFIGNAASIAVPILVSNLTNWSRLNLNTFEYSTDSEIHERATPVAPMKTKDENEENALLLMIQALGRLGELATEAIPVLQTIRQRGRGRLREAAAESVVLISTPQAPNNSGF